MPLAVKRGTILSCYFPLNEMPDSPGPQARPALALGAFPNPQNRSETMVIVAYGTSRISRAYLGHDLRIEGVETMAAAGLHRPTRFTMNRLRILPLNEEYFDYSAAGNPIIGILPPPELGKLARYLDDLADHAEELNFFRPKEALAKGKVFNPTNVDSFMKTELTGTQHIRRSRRGRPNIYRRSR